MKHCIACGEQPTVHETSLCANCYADTCNGDTSAMSVIENIEARYTERVADLEGLLEQYKQKNEQKRQELNRLEARLADCHCDEREMIAKYERHIVISVAQDEDNMPHHPLCECDECDGKWGLM